MSTTYRITSLTTLATDTVSLDELSRSLKLNSIVSCDDRPLGLVTHWDLVFFARTWAGWALEECGERPPSALEALSLVDQWLQDPGSVSSEELRAAKAAAGAAKAAAEAAAGAAAGAAEAAAGAAEAAAEAAEAAARAAGAAAWAAAEAAAGAARAAEAAARAAWAAARAAGAAAWAAGAASFRKQGEFITEHLKNSSPSSFPFPST